MADEYGAQGLNGPEIIDDIVAQFRKKLTGDCNLRPQDSYSRGYSAKITFSVRCYGLDEQVIDGDMKLGEERDEPIDDGADGELIIDQEDNIDEVRDRVEEARQTENGPEVVEEEDLTEVPTINEVRQKRKYTRKVKLAASGVIGGTEDFKE